MASNSSIFKAYDIRGIAPDDFGDDVPARVGAALVALTGAKKIILGFDARTSSPELVSGVREGLLMAGADVVEIGLCTTPMFNFAVASDAAIGAGIMVTASHNPPQYNGFKMVSAGARPISGVKMGEAMNAVTPVPAVIPKPRDHGKTTKLDVLPEYINAILELSEWDAAWAQVVGTIVIDAGNGMGGVPLAHFLERTAIDAKILYGEVDCSFPNHEANPVKESTLADLKKTVVADGAAFGVAFDGDADRIGFVDENGERIAGDHIGALIAEELLALTSPQERGSSVVLGDTNAGWAFKEAVEHAGGKFELTPVGHANIKVKMRATKALFAAELSYHFYYREFYNVESTLLTLLLVLRRFAREGKTMSKLVAPYRKYFASGEINIEVKNPVELLKKVRAAYEKDAVRVIDEDGIRIEFKDWWFSLRASNTEPVVRLNVEAKTSAALEERVKKLISSI